MAELLRDVKSLHPYGPRALVVDPPAEPQRPSGIILPAGVDEYSVGIVLESGDAPGWDSLPSGSVVYYWKGHGVEIGGNRVIGLESVIAWEPA
jgi:hypothetical protein